MNRSRKALCFVLQVIGPHPLAFIGRNTDRNIIMHDSTSKYRVVIDNSVFKGFISLP